MPKGRELLGLSGVAAAFAMIAAEWGALPSRIPVRFTPDGLPDGDGGKSALFVFLGFELVYYALLAAIQLRPQSHFYPLPVRDDNRSALYAMSAEMTGWAKVQGVWSLDYVLWSLIEVGLRRVSGLNVPVILLLGWCTLITLVIFYVRISRIVSSPKVAARAGPRRRPAGLSRPRRPRD